MADLLDRNTTALYGMTQKPIPSQKLEKTGDLTERATRATDKTGPQVTAPFERPNIKPSSLKAGSIVMSDSEGEDIENQHKLPKIVDNRSAISIVDSSKLPMTFTTLGGAVDTFNETVKFNNKVFNKLNHMDQIPIKIDQKCICS